MGPASTPGDREIDPNAIETDLRARRAEIEARLTEMKKPPERGSTIGFGKRIGDGTTEAVSRLTEVALASDMEEMLAKIDRALEKLEDGTYGICDGCGNPIPFGRLKVSPASVLCVECAARRP